MPLHRKDGLGFVFYAFDALVVGVHEPTFQRRFFKTIYVNSVSVILCGDITAIRLQVECGLVLAAMSVFQLVSVSASGKRENLVSEANAKSRNFFGK